MNDNPTAEFRTSHAMQEQKKFTCAPTEFVSAHQQTLVELLGGHFDWANEAFAEFAQSPNGKVANETFWSEIDLNDLGLIGRFAKKTEIEYVTTSIGAEGLTTTPWPRPCVNVELWDLAVEQEEDFYVSHYSPDLKFSAFAGNGYHSIEYSLWARIRYLDETKNGKKLGNLMMIEKLSSE